MGEQHEALTVVGGRVETASPLALGDDSQERGAGHHWGCAVILPCHRIGASAAFGPSLLSSVIDLLNTGGWLKLISWPGYLARALTLSWVT